MKNGYDEKVLKKAADEILDSIDYGKIWRVMELLNWRWTVLDEQGLEIGQDVPSVARIKESATRIMYALIKEFIRNGTVAIRSGGFEATLDHGFFSLDFRIESASLENYEGEWI